MISTLYVIGALLLVSQESAGQSRLRPTDPTTAALIQLGLQRSVTLRGLIAEIEAGDVIVYVFRQVSLPRRLAGHMTLVGRAGQHRYVRIWIDSELPPKHFIVSLAHELQHVSEVIAHPEVDDDASMRDLYERIGDRSRVAGQLAFETEAARRTGLDVHREMSITRDVQQRITTPAQPTRGARVR